VRVWRTSSSLNGLIIAITCFIGHPNAAAFSV
jgi:hypothetical protein